MKQTRALVTFTIDDCVDLPDEYLEKGQEDVLRGAVLNHLEYPYLEVVRRASHVCFETPDGRTLGLKNRADLPQTLDKGMIL
jgi:hypothetical protein